MRILRELLLRILLLSGSLLLAAAIFEGALRWRDRGVGHYEDDDHLSAEESRLAAVAVLDFLATEIPPLGPSSHVVQ